MYGTTHTATQLSIAFGNGIKLYVRAAERRSLLRLLRNPKATESCMVKEPELQCPELGKTCRHTKLRAFEAIDIVGATSTCWVGLVYDGVLTFVSY